MATHKKTSRLQQLKGSGFEIGKNQPDIRGWEVRDESGRKIGDVNELIFDIQERKVRYLVIDVIDSKELELDKRTIMVPIGLGILDHKDNDVILRNVNAFQLRALPAYRKDDLGTKAEMAIATVFGRQYTSKSDDNDHGLVNEFYQHDHFNENIWKGGDQNNSVSNRNQRTEEEARRKALSDAEASSLLRDAELGTPVSNLETGEHTKERRADREDKDIHPDDPRYKKRDSGRGLF